MNDNIRRHTGDAEVLTYPKDSGVSISVGDLVVLTAGKLVKAVASATKETLKGVYMGDVAGTGGVVGSIDVPQNPTDIFRAKVGAGTYLATMIGSRYDLNGDGQVDLTAQTEGVVEVIGNYPDTDEILIRFVQA